MFLQVVCSGEAARMKTAEERQSWARSFCEKTGMRLTPVREAVIVFFAQRRVPATLEMVCRAEGVSGRCDATTIYRTLMLFKDAELIRSVGTPSKTSYFVLNVPGDDAYFLICRQCGCIKEIPLPDAVSQEIQRAATSYGYSLVPQDCEIYGYCPMCQAQRKRSVPTAKLLVRITTPLSDTREP